MDVTKPEQIKDAFAKTKEHFGRLDVVVNNAGYAVSAEIEATPDEVARDQFETLFWGPVNVSKEVCTFRGEERAVRLTESGLELNCQKKIRSSFIFRKALLMVSSY